MVKHMWLQTNNDFLKYSFQYSIIILEMVYKKFKLDFNV